MAAGVAGYLCRRSNASQSRGKCTDHAVVWLVLNSQPMAFVRSSLQRMVAWVALLGLLSATSAATAEPKVYDVAVFGAGPVGTFTANEVDRQAREAGLAPPKIFVL